MANESRTLRSHESPSEPTRTEDPLGVIGRTIGGKYEIKEHLGAGGFGEVYEAVNVNLRDQRLVVKFFKRIQAREKFDKEARILCKLDHPNISRVVDYLPEDSAIVIHRIDGQDAETQLWESGPLPSDRLLTVARTMVEAIAYAHSQGIAHRDLKPSNILIDRNGHVYLIDFGIAKEIGGTATKTGRVALTPNFAAPERHAGIHSYNPFLSDIYELGVTLFNLATRSLPYHNPASPALSEWRTNAGQKLAPAFRRILKKAMDPDPASRYGSAQEMAVDLAKIKEAYVTPPRKALVIAGTAVVLIATALVARDRFLGSKDASSLFPDEQAELSAPAAIGASKLRPLGPYTAAVAGSPADSVVPEESLKQEAPPPLPEKRSPAVSTQPAAPKKQASAQPPAAQPVMARQTVHILPSAAHVQVSLDGRTQSPGEPFHLKAGDYRLTVIHPDFPLFTQPLLIEAGKEAAVTYNLGAAFAGHAEARLQLAVVPPTETHLLTLTLNGREHNFSVFPVLDFALFSGSWQVEAEVAPLNGTPNQLPVVDSCLYYAGGSRTPVSIRGGSGLLELAGGRGRLLVFWSRN